MNTWFNSLSSQPNGLVLGGGGARGFYQVGAWKAFTEQKIVFERVAGTSIGALVGAMYVQQSLNEMIHLVQTIHPTEIAADLFAFPETLGAWVRNRREIGSFLQKYILSREGMDISPLKDVIDEMFRYPVFHHSPINYACMTFNLTKKEPEAYFKSEMTQENAQDIILASASCYPAFPVLKMNGNDYIDGGYWDNVPIDLAARMGARKILAIDVEGPGVILPQKNQSLDVFEIKPVLPLGNFLDFTREACMKNLQAGYLETNRLLGIQCGFLFSFPAEDQSQLAVIDGYLQFMFQIHHIVISQKNLEAVAQWADGFHSSDLSRVLMKNRREGILLESLAFLVGVDPYRLWSFQAFMQELEMRLRDLQKKYSRVQDYISAIGRGELDKAGAVCVMVSILERSPIDKAKSELTPLSAVYPAEAALAWTWYFLERVGGKNDENTDSSRNEA